MGDTVFDAYTERARTSGDAPALLAPDGPPWSYAKLVRGLVRAGEALGALGYGQGSRIALALPNGRDTAAALLATSTWTTAAPLDPRIDESSARRLFAAMRIDALVVAREGLDAPAARAARETGVALIVTTPADEGDDDLLHYSTDAPRRRIAPRRPASGDIALVMHTSGTTGTPRVVAMSQAVVDAIPVHAWLRTDDRCMSFAPLHTVSGYGSGLVFPLRSGASSLIVPGYEERAFFAWLERFRPTYFTASPTVHAAIADAIERRGARLPDSMRFARSSSTGLDPALQARLEAAYGVPVVQGYGTTEGGLIAQDAPSERRHGTVGKPLTEIAIVEDEILVRGPGVVSGYENDAEATRAAFHDGWFRTGDLGRIDDDGYLSLTGRVKEMINRGGLKVAPAEVDAVLLAHRDVRDAATVGIAHRSLGEDVVAAVVLKPGATADADALRRYAHERLPPSKAPSRIVVVDAIPRGALGKVRRSDLARSIETQLRAAHAAPRDDDERRVAAAFADVLKLDDVGVHDHFFELGGDSLSAAQVLARLAADSGLSLSAAALFEAPTVERLARTLAAARERMQAEPPLTRRERRPQR